jgi:hypothetical protein
MTVSGPAFRVPIDTLKALGGGDAAAGHAALCASMGCYGHGVGIIPGEMVQAIGNGSLSKGRAVLNKFVAMVRSQRTKTRAA